MQRQLQKDASFAAAWSDLVLPLSRAKKFISRLADLFGIICTCIFSKSITEGDGTFVILTKEKRFKLFFERAGGGFVKLGQILSMRQDFLPPEYTEELLGLLSSVPVTDWSEMAEVFRQELGERPETFFKEIETEPIASASIGQVYRAKMKDDSIVAVKIRRPKVLDAFENDFILAGFLGELVGVFTFIKAMPVQDVIAEFIVSTRAELDFRNEAKNAAILGSHSEYHPDVIIPRPYLEHSSEQVLIMEFLSDITTAEKALKLLGEDQNYRHNLKKTERIDLDESAYLFVIDGIRQYFIDGFFHADPHPGNVFFMSDNRIGFFDFGLIGRAGKKRDVGARILYSIAHRDIYSTSKYFLSYAKESFEKELALYRQAGKALDEKYDAVLQKIEEIMIDNFALDLEEILTPWYEAVDAGVEGELDMKSLRKKSASIVLSKIINMSLKYDITLPKEMILFFRSLSIADMVALRLNPHFDMMKAIQRFFHEHPLSTVEDLIKSGEHETAIESNGEIATMTGQSYEGLMELRLQDEERLQVARERLAELVDRYAEEYEEVRALLKP